MSCLRLVSGLARDRGFHHGDFASGGIHRYLSAERQRENRLDMTDRGIPPSGNPQRGNVIGENLF